MMSTAALSTRFRVMYTTSLAKIKVLPCQILPLRNIIMSALGVLELKDRLSKIITRLTSTFRDHTRGYVLSVQEQINETLSHFQHSLV